jgi:hypothetical protein
VQAAYTRRQCIADAAYSRLPATFGASVLAAVHNLTHTSLQFGALVRVQDRLAETPPPPGVPAKLVKALDQMALIYTEIDAAIAEYLTLDFQPPTDSEDRRRLARAKQHLQYLATGHTRNELASLVGHCGEITTIYRRDLRPWFEARLDAADAEALETLFMENVGSFDGDIVAAVRELTEWITRKAEETLELVREERYAEANAHILAADKEVFDARQRLLAGLNLLREPKGTFLALA